MKSFVIACSISVMILLVTAPSAQAQNNGNSGNGGSQAPKVPVTPVIVAPSTGNRAPQIPTVPEIIYIAGSVAREDGTPPPFNTIIELDCGDTITREAIVGSEGRFGFQVGSNNRIGRVQPDPSDRIDQDVFDAAEEAQNLGSRGWSTSMRTTPLSIRLLRCEVRARYPGYRSTSSRMRPGAIFGYTEVDPILMYPIEKVPGTSVSLSSLLAPKEARKMMEQANKALRKDNFSEAEALLQSAIKIYPENAEAWYLLGETFYFQNRSQEAKNSYSKALDVDKVFVRPYLRLSRIAIEEKDWVNAVDYTGEALKLDPIAFPEAYYLSALANFNFGDLETAERSARKGQRLDLDHQHPQLHLILANILSMKQDTEGAMEEMRNYLKVAPKAEDAPLVRERLEETEELAKAEKK